MSIKKKSLSADKPERLDNDNIIRFPDRRVQDEGGKDNQLSPFRQEEGGGELVSNVDRMIAKANKAMRKAYELDDEGSDKILRILIERGLFKESQIHLSGHGLKGCLIETDDGLVPLRDFLEEKYIGEKVVEHKTSNPSLQEDGGDELMSDDSLRIAEAEKIMSETYNLIAECRDEILKIFIEEGFLEKNQIHLDEEGCLIETDDGLIPLADFSGYLREKSIDRKAAEYRATKEGRTAERRKTTLDYMKEWDEKKKSEQQNVALKDED